MNILYALLGVIIMSALGYLGGSVAGLRTLFGSVIPYTAILIFLAGVTYRMIRWARSPVPFRIPTTCGQQKSLPWIKHASLDSPSSALGAVIRMTMEILVFRSLHRNTKAELREGPIMAYGADRLLWVGSLAFHWAFLLIFLRHLRFFMEPVPRFVLAIQRLDGLFQIAAPVLYVTDLILPAALVYLIIRRLMDPRLRYISLLTDYFALFLLLGLAVSGVYMRYFSGVDVLLVKELALGLVTFSPIVPAEIRPVFFVHLFMLSALISYFPFSKLMHMGGVFLSPTRNLANNSRMRRHINPWNPPVKVHTYQEWEDEFRDKMRACGLPLERE